MSTQYRIRKRLGRYRLEQLLGFTDGRPSWGQATLQRFSTRAAAAEHLQRLRVRNFATAFEAAGYEVTPKVGQS